MDMNWPLFSIGMTDTWRKGRKMLEGSLRPSATMSYRQVIEERTSGLLVQLYANPKDFRSYVKLSVDRPLS
jgi:cytochrome P450